MPYLFAAAIFSEVISKFDDTVYGIISSLISDGMSRFMVFITFWGSEPAITAINLIILFAAFIRKRRKYFNFALLVSSNIIAGAVLNYCMKQLFHRPRPDILRLVEIGGFSFPSGHSMASIIFYGFFIYLAARYAGNRSKYAIATALSTLVLLIGISRIYLGVHYASDVLGGFIIGLGWLLIFIRLSKRYFFPKCDAALFSNTGSKDVIKTAK